MLVSDRLISYRGHYQCTPAHPDERHSRLSSIRNAPFNFRREIRRQANLKANSKDFSVPETGCPHFLENITSGGYDFDSKAPRCTLATMKSLGQRVHELREAKDLSLRELSAWLRYLALFYLILSLTVAVLLILFWRAIAKALGTTFEDLSNMTQAMLDELRRRV